MQILGLDLVRCGWYVLLAVMFLMFVHFNNGMVVGDRSAHVVTLHLSQLGYFSAFFTLLTLQEHSRLSSDCQTECGKDGDIVVIIYYNTRAHLYLLADNRHYFYTWRRNMMRHLSIKYTWPAHYPFLLIKSQLKPNCWRSLAIESTLITSINFLINLRPFYLCCVFQRKEKQIFHIWKYPEIIKGISTADGQTAAGDKLAMGTSQTLLD